MSYLFFDTETTGFINKGLAPDDPKQARVCQLGALLTDKAGRTMAQLDVLIKPTNWTISPRLTEIHGISHEMAVAYGIPALEALEMFESFLHRAEVIVSHNFTFDRDMIQLEHKAAGVVASIFSQKANCCTMMNSIDICKIPHPSRGGYKWPKLQEIYVKLFEREFNNAHNAMADVVACKEVFFEIQRLETV
jgi:DNA polymerase-3 subunit epsilon